jgi:hypothetical protein
MDKNRQAPAPRGRAITSGRAKVALAELRKEIARLRKAGETYRAIADVLNAKSRPTRRQGAKWYAASVRAVELADLRAKAEALGIDPHGMTMEKLHESIDHARPEQT